MKRLVMVISSVQTKEVLERWEFVIDNGDTDTKENTVGKDDRASKDEKKIRAEIGDVMRQITASVTFLPLLEERCSFDVLIYTSKAKTADEETPAGM